MAVLTTKQQRFVDEYLIDFNATQAAIRAGYSENTAYSIGNENLSKPDIKNAIDEKISALEKSSLLTKEMVIKGLLSETKEYGEGSSHSARVSAWAHLGKHLNMFTEKVELSGKVEVATLGALIDELSEDEP